MKKERGFTLIELMIVVVVLAILSALAIFNYSRYTYRSRRVDGKEMLSRVAAAEERYYTVFNKYTTALGDLGYTTNNACSAVGCSDRGYYIVSATSDGQSYSLNATPRPPQDTDACGVLKLNSSNLKSFDGNDSNGACW